MAIFIVFVAVEIWNIESNFDEPVCHIVELLHIVPKLFLEFQFQNWMELNEVKMF